MDPLGKSELLSFYDRHLKDFGDSPQSVRWTAAGQLRRYEALLRLSGDLSGKRVLDFGCGKGDFYGFLTKESISVNYCGLDVNRNLIELAGRKYPDAEVRALDIDETDINEKFDVVFICGTFNLRIAGIEETVRNVLKKLFGLCREALYVNFLSFYVPRRDFELFYVKPDEMVRFVLSELSRSLTFTREGEDIYLAIYNPSYSQISR